ncbi:hypothetical protein QBC44DRAFT_357085 [Cladorrhinum sp. PSN332]|nr:hypothetical protein QBC44DRAFT_357085 [Cladorrhinum sp. PSN332]
MSSSYYDTVRIASWVITIAGGILSIGVLGFAVRDLVRPVYFSKNGNAVQPRNPSGALKGVILGLVCALVRTIFILIILSNRVYFFGINLIWEFFGVCTAVLAYVSLLRVTRRFQSSGGEGDGATVTTVSNMNSLDCVVMTLLSTLGFACWGLDLGVDLRYYYGDGPGPRYPAIRNAMRGLAVAYNAWLVVTSLYITWRLLSKRRQARYSVAASPSDLNARVTFTLKTIPTMVFISIIALVANAVTTFIGFGFETNYRAWEALQVLTLLAMLIGEILLLEYSRGALRRLASS